MKNTEETKPQRNKSPAWLGISVGPVCARVHVCVCVCARGLGASHGVNSPLPSASRDRKKHVLATPRGVQGGAGGWAGKLARSLASVELLIGASPFDLQRRCLGEFSFFCLPSIKEEVEDGGGSGWKGSNYSSIKPGWSHVAGSRSPGGYEPHNQTQTQHPARSRAKTLP